MAGTTSPLRRLWWLGLSMLFLVVYGVVGFMLVQGWGFLDSVYMTVITLSTVGFREARPLEMDGRLFTVSLITLGVGLVFVTVSVVAGMIAEGELGIRNRRKRMQRRIDAMRDHFIICAYGRVGRAVAREFERAGVPFVVIDPKEELEERMVEDGVAYLVNDPSDEHVLDEAGVTRARGLVCAVDSDATNVYITLMARSINPRLFIVARASEPGSPARLQRAGSDRVVSPFVSSGHHMARMALRPKVADVLEVGETFAPTSLELEELVVSEGSELQGQTVAQAGGPAPVLAVKRSGGEILPNPPADLVLVPGDLVLLLAEGELRSS